MIFAAKVRLNSFALEIYGVNSLSLSRFWRNFLKRGREIKVWGFGLLSVEREEIGWLRGGTFVCKHI